MKFSNNLFKIQAKISASALILMSSVCYLGAMEDVANKPFARLSRVEMKDAGVQTDSYSIDPSVSFKPRKLVGFDEAIKGRLLNRTKQPPKQPRVGPLDKQKVYVNSALLSPDTPGNVESSVTPDSTVRFSMDSAYVSFDASPPQHRDDVNPLMLVSQSVVDREDEIPLSPILRKKQGVEKRGADLIASGTRLDFDSEEFSEGLELVSGNSIASIFQPNSILTASPDDQIALQIQAGGELVEVQKTISQLLKPIEFGGASTDLTVIKDFFEVFNADEKERAKKIKKIKKKKEYSELDDMGVTALLRQNAINAYPRIIEYFMEFARQSKYDKSALTLFVDGVKEAIPYFRSLERQNINLNKQIASLNEAMMSSFDKMNSAFAVFGLTLQKTSVEDGSLITQVRETYSKLRGDNDKLRDDYMQIASLHIQAAEKLDAANNRETELRAQLEAANNREAVLREQLDAATAREDVLLEIIKSIPDAKRKWMEKKSSKSLGTGNGIGKTQLKSKANA